MRYVRLVGLIAAILAAFMLARETRALDKPHDVLLCQHCHSAGKNFSSNQGLDLSTVCLDCHRPGGKGSPITPSPANPYGSANALTQLGKGTEHNFMGSDQTANPRAKAQIPRHAEYAGTFVTGQISCASCHNPHLQPGGQQGGKFLRVAADADDTLCLHCHGSMNVTAVGGASHPLTGFAGLTSSAYFPFPQLSSMRAAFVSRGNKVTCMVCHTPHNAYPFASPTSTTRGNAKLLRGHGSDWACAQCHKKPIHGNTKSSPEPTCGTCHDIHNPGSNLRLVKNILTDNHTGQSISVSFTNDVAATDFYNAQGSGICQVCHTKTKFFRSYSTSKYNVIGNATHNEQSQVCTMCHNHEEDSNFVAPGLGQAPGFQKKAFGKESCGTCHGFPPNTGAHLVHSNSNTDKTDCAMCHPGADTYTTGPSGNHQQSGLSGWSEANYETSVRSFINVDTFITKDTGTTPYATKRLNNTCAGGTGNPCHASTATTPRWGDTVLSCDACHANPPATGNHTVHATTNGIACSDCHYSVKTDTTDTRSHIAGITGATDADAMKKKAWDTTNYTYTIAVNDRDRNNGVSSYNGVDKSCANVQCHNPSPAGTKKARWGVDTPSCTLCHENAAIATGSHGQHLTASTNYGITVTCNNCHPAVGGTSYNHFIASLNTIEISGPTYTGGVVPGDGNFGSCGTNTCHTNGAGGAANDLGYTWGTVYAGDTCNMCHATLPNTYRHNVHWNSYIPNINPQTAGQCTYCHSAQTASTHVNGTVNVATTNPSRITTFNYNGAGAADDSCQANCHSQPTATLVWSAPAPTKCTSCHYYGNNLPAPHANHFFNQPFRNYTAASQNHAACGACHPGSESYTTTLNGTHGNGIKNVGTGSISRVSGWTNPTCTNSCHTGGSWITSPTALACADCHGNPPTTYKHTSHSTRAIACGACHNGINTTPHLNMTHNETYTNFTSGPAYMYQRAKGFLAYSAIEVDDRQYNNGTTSTWNKTAKTCATAKCHNPSPGASYSADWRNESSSCTLCHGDASTLTSGSHAAHLASQANGFGRNIACSDCHNNNAPNYAHFMVGGAPRAFVDFSGAVYFRYTTADKIIPGTRNTGYCSTNTCHNNGKGTSFAAVSSKIHWGTTMSNGVTVACNICHNFNPNTGSHFDHFSTATTASYGPRMNVSSSAANCNQCHNNANTTAHLNGAVNFRDGDKTMSQTNSCNTCHTTAAAATAKSYWAAGTKLGCDTCHTTKSSVTAAYSKYTTSIAGGVYADKFAAYTSKGHGRKTVQGNYSGGGGTANPPANRVCLDCHGQTSWASGGTHITNVTQDFKRLTQSSSNAQCNYCHGSNQPGFSINSGIQTHMGTSRFTGTMPTFNCGDCHELHGGSLIKPVNGNFKMIRATNYTYYSSTVVFTRRTGTNSFDESDGTANADDLCATCHKNTYHDSRYKDARHGTANNGADQGGTDCKQCHNHKTSFKPSGCNACHAGATSVDGAPRTMTEALYNTGKTSADVEAGMWGAHKLHVDDLKNKMSCDDCHGAGASSGTHTGHNAGNGTPARANLTMVPNTANNWKGLTITYTNGGSPATSNCSNAKCHFGNSPKWKCAPYNRYTSF